MKRVLSNVKTYEVGGYENPFNPSMQGAIRFAFRSYHASKSILNKEKVDIIHHFFPVQYPRCLSLLPFDKAVMARYPFVVGPISFPTYWPRNAYGRFIDFLSKPFFKKCLEEADFITAQTRHTTELVKNVVPNTDVLTVPLCVDTDFFKPNNANEDELEVLTVANLLPLKGVDYLIDAIRYVKKHYSDIVLRVIGSGPHEKYLKKLTIRRGLAHNVLFEGHVPHQDIVNYYNKATIFCLPSLTETFGVVMLEAMACGKPVVATKTEGAKEILHQGEDGLLVEIGDSESIANALLFLLDHPAIIVSMGAKGRESCEKKYSWNSIARIYFGIYESLLE
jgi:glycosyltransferase involved in cell wall biosynthesis